MSLCTVWIIPHRTDVPEFSLCMMLHENLRDVPTNKEHVRPQCDWLVHKMAFLFKKLSKALKRQISCVRDKKHFIVHSIFIQKETSLSYCISSRYTFKCEFCSSNHRHSKLWPSSLLQSRPAHEFRNLISMKALWKYPFTTVSTATHLQCGHLKKSKPTFYHLIIHKLWNIQPLIAATANVFPLGFH